jgi:hypothetical protein
MADAHGVNVRECTAELVDIKLSMSKPKRALKKNATSYEKQTEESVP